MVDEMITSKLNYILDPVHGHISITTMEQKIIESTLFNRLNYITQLSTIFFVYPSANHVRSAHSIGVMYLSSKYFTNALNNASEDILNEFLMYYYEKIIDIVVSELKEEEDKKGRYDNNIDLRESLNLENKYHELRNFNFNLHSITEEEIDTFVLLLQAIRIAALLHDIGHLPFSHLVETSLETAYNLIVDKGEKSEGETEYCNLYDEYVTRSDFKLHELMGSKMINLIFKEILHVDDVSKEDKRYVKIIKKLVQNIIEDKTEEYKTLHRIIASMVDADRLDYVIRDSLSIGSKNISYDLEKVLLNTILVKRNEKFFIEFRVDAIDEIEHFLHSRFHLYNSFLFSSNSLKKYQILNQVLVRSVVRYLKSKKDGEDNEFSYELPLDISGLWLPLKVLSCHECKFYDLTDALFQYDENWLMHILKMEYFKLEREYYKDDNYFINSPRTRKHFYGLREILFGENIFTSLWDHKNQFAAFFAIPSSQIPILTKKILLPKNKKNLIASFKKLINKYTGIDVYFAIRVFSNGYDKGFTMIDNDNEQIAIGDISQVNEIMKKMVYNEAPFYFYIRNDLEQRLTIESFKADLKDILNEFIKQDKQEKEATAYV